MTSEEHRRKLERMFARAPINAFFRPELRIDDGEATLVLPVRRDFHHAAEGVHGAVYFKALDDVAFFAVNSLVEDVFVLTVSFTVYLTRPIAEGEMRAHGKVVHASRRLYVAEAELTDGEGRQIARGSGTFMKSTVRLTEEIGYA